MSINLDEPPPRRWILGTVTCHTGPERLGANARHLVYGLQGGDPDIGLANRIIADAPRFLSGKNLDNLFAHGGWAYLVLGRNPEAWGLLGPLRRSVYDFLAHRIFTTPTASALVLIYAALRLGHNDIAKLAISLARLRCLTQSETKDLAMLSSAACARRPS